MSRKSQDYELSIIRYLVVATTVSIGVLLVDWKACAVVVLVFVLNYFFLSAYWDRLPMTVSLQRVSRLKRQGLHKDIHDVAMNPNPENIAKVKQAIK